VVGLLVGGISMDGGEGKLIGAVLGVTLMQIINNAIVLLYLNPSYTQVITGGILILAVAVDQLSKKRKVAAK
jgi:ribose transport system permease protein